TLRGAKRLVAKREDRRPGKYLQAVDLGELHDDVLGDAVAEVLVFLRAAQVLEVENGDGLLGALRGAGPRIGLLGRAPLARLELVLEPQQVGFELRRRLAAQLAVLFGGLLADAAGLPRHAPGPPLG